ncbi:MAG: autotransporter outer membrane beta-barrel domain-containing protein, partial [Treponema sp.]|nr:autotransporter outer membrane beta-barrel domain-containing protein [Treponema sp.]
LIGTVAVAALLASAAFAELNMGAWIRTVVAPVASNGEDILSGWTNSWGWGIRNARIGFNWTSDDEKVGMLYDIFGDGAGGFGPGDYRAGWYKPADSVKFMVGHIDNGYTMRSDLCFGSWNWIRPVNWIFDDEGLTFNLGNADALQIEIFPVEGLQILGRLAMPADGGFQDAYKMFEQSTFAAGYTIGDIGTIKAAWNGNGDRKGDDYKYLGDVQAAFDLTGVDNLFITVGVKVSIAESDYKDLSDDFAFLKAAVGASYQILDNLKVLASFGMQTYEVADPVFQFGVGVDVGLTDTLSLAADFRGLLANDDAVFSFLIGLGWGFSSNGSIGIGFQGTTNGWGFNPQTDPDADPKVITPAKADAFCWAVPISFSYSF